ncbi:reverse transcriptase domain-containing protein [Tanacetum coccineum]
MANITPIVTTVTKPTTKEKTSREADATPRVNIQDFCEEHYEDIMTVIMEKFRLEKQKEVHARLDFEESPKKRRIREGSQNSSARTLFARYQIILAVEVALTGGSPSRDRPQSRDCSRSVEESYDHTRSSYGTGTEHGYRSRDRNRSCYVKRGRKSESPLSHISESSTSDEGHWKSKSKRHRSTDEDDLAVPWICEEVERWAMPTWCHMFNSTLIGAARVWFDELPPESIDGYKDLKVAFFAYFMQKKKYVKDPAEIYNIEQRDGETIEEFMERFKRLNEHDPKTMEEMMIATTAFIRGKATAAGKNRGLTSEASQGKDGGLAGLPPYKNTQEILATETRKFKSPPPMVNSVEKRSSNKFCNFHNDKGYSTDEYMQQKKQIEELVRAGKLSHLIKEIKQGRDQPKAGKKEVTTEDKSMAIYMIQPWHGVTRQKGSSTEVLYEHCFNRLRPEIKSQMVSTTTSLTGFSGETIWPLGQLRLLVMIRDADRSTKAWMNFMIVRSLSLYNGIIGRSGIREIQAVPSTAYEMLKFPADGTILIPAECATVTTSSKEIPKEAGVRQENFKVAPHSNFPD